VTAGDGSAGSPHTRARIEKEAEHPSPRVTHDPEARDDHRPPTVEARRPAILELLRQGLRTLDIAATMRLPIGEVLEAARSIADAANRADLRGNAGAHQCTPEIIHRRAPSAGAG